MFRTKISFQGGMNLLGDLSGSDRECLWASSADLRTGVIRPFAAPTWYFQAPVTESGDTAYFFTYRGKWYFSTAERDYVGTFNQGSEIVVWTEYGGIAQKIINGVQAVLGTNPPIAPLIAKNSDPIYTTSFEATRVPGAGGLPTGQRFYRLSAKNAFGILPPTAEISVNNNSGDANILQWNHINGLTGWVLFGSSVSGQETTLAELPPETTSFTDVGAISGGIELASGFDTPGTRTYLYTYKRTVGGFTDESGPSALSYPLDYKHGVTLQRDPSQDGYFSYPDAQIDNVMRVGQTPVNAHVVSWSSMGQFDAIRFVCDAPHGLVNGELVYFNGAGWASDNNYANATYTCYVPEGQPTIFFLEHAPRPVAVTFPFDSTFTVTTSTFVVTLQGLHDPNHDPIPFDPLGSAPGDAMFLNLGTLGTQMVKVVGWDPSLQQATVVGKGISQITGSERRHPTTTTFIPGTGVAPTFSESPGYPFANAIDDNFATQAVFQTGGYTGAAQMLMGGWQPKTATTYTSHVTLKIEMALPFCVFHGLDGTGDGMLLVEVSTNNGVSWSTVFNDHLSVLTLAPLLSFDLGAITVLTGIQVRFTANPNSIFGVYEIWTEAATSDSFGGSSGTAQWVNNNAWITSWDIYRTGDTPDFLLVDEVDPYTLSFTDTKPTLALGRAVTSFYNDGTQDVIYKPPPVGLLGLTNHNGSWMGIDGNLVRYTPAGVMDAWPDAYVQAFDEKPMAIVSHNGAAHTLLKDGVWRADGSDPSILVWTKTAAADGCIAPNSAQIVRNKIVYLGPRGITVYDGMRSECISDRRMPVRYILGAAGDNPNLHVPHPSWSNNGRYLDGNYPIIPATMTRAFEDAVAEFGAPPFGPNGGSNTGPGPIWNDTAGATRLRNMRSFVYQGRYYLYWSNNAFHDFSGFVSESWGCFVVDFESEDMPISFLPLRIADALVSEDQVPYWLIRAVMVPFREE